ncbi:uncharacterized protein LOC113342696 [Papaver somniferum]|uniref:uncharacterized protein LOC113342696 n=1 Tax=Papaver somniferum TaxID=3469 RepID=UPI000E7047F6|nr:uncharacterized protein LOC113342696 [Papaver somniferum]
MAHFFPSSFEDDAVAWFKCFPSNSVHSFNDIKTLFIHSYSCNIKQADVLENVFRIAQQLNESFTDFLRRFKAAATPVDKSQEKFICPFSRIALQKGKIIDSFSGKVLESLEEVYHKAEKWVMRKQDQELSPEAAKHKVYLAVQHSGDKRTYSPRSPDQSFKEKIYRAESAAQWLEERKHFAKLNALPEVILKHMNNKPHFSSPTKMRNEGNNKSLCAYHETTVHHTNDCKNMLRFIHDMVKKGHLTEFVVQKQVTQNNKSLPRQVKGMVNMIYFVPRSGPDAHIDLTDIKRKLCEFNVTCMHASCEGLLLPSDDIRFTAKDLAGVTFPHSDALVVELVIGGWDCRKILIDQGSTCDIIFLQEAEKMELTKEGSLRANDSAIMGFNDSRTYPMGEITLTVEAGPIKINVAFVVLNTKSLYN